MIGLLLVGCASRYAILTVPAASMTHSSFEAGHTATEIGPVTAKFCQGDTPLSSQDHNVGLIDEVILKAEKQSEASYLKDVTILRDSSCVVVEATAMK